MVRSGSARPVRVVHRDVEGPQLPEVVWSPSMHLEAAQLLFHGFGIVAPTRGSDMWVSGEIGGCAGGRGGPGGGDGGGGDGDGCGGAWHMTDLDVV
jgi:hypothetical protein